MHDKSGSWFDPQNWHIDDPHPELALVEISPHSARAWAALSRAKDRNIVRQHLISIVGGIDMMRGLEYHNANFCRVVTELASLPFLDPTALERRLFLVHETVAYVNRLGQFYYFASSELVSSAVPAWSDIIPTIAKFKRVRDKHTAHRSLDVPRRDDDPFVQEMNAWSFSSLGGYMSFPKPGKTPPVSLSDFMDPHKAWTEYYPGFQLQGDGKRDTLFLSIERDHPIFIDEAYELISAVLSQP